MAAGVDLTFGDGTTASVDVHSIVLETDAARGAVADDLYAFEGETSNREFYRLAVSSLINTTRSTPVPAAIEVTSRIDEVIGHRELVGIRRSTEWDIRYDDLLEDLRRHYGVDENVPSGFNPGDHVDTPAVIKDLVLGVVVQVYWLVVGLFNERPDAAILFLFGPGRFLNYESVLQEADRSELDHQFVSLGLRPLGYYPEYFQRFGAVSLGRYTSVRALRWYCQHCIPLVFASVRGDVAVVRETVTYIQEEWGIDLTHCVHASFARGMQTNAWVFAKYAILREVAEAGDIQCLCLGSGSPQNELISLGAEESGCTVYNLHHSPMGGFANPKQLHFVEGEMTTQFLRRLLPDASHYLATGRPYLTDLYRKYGERSREGGITRESVECVDL
jgi:hypothetical protein